MTAAEDKRNELLDQLQSAVDTWSKQEQTRLETEVKFLRAAQQGRGAAKTGTQNLATAGTSVLNEIGKYIRNI